MKKLSNGLIGMLIGFAALLGVAALGTLTGCPNVKADASSNRTQLSHGRVYAFEHDNYRYVVYSSSSGVLLLDKETIEEYRARTQIKDTEQD